MQTSWNKTQRYWVGKRILAAFSFLSIYIFSYCIHFIAVIIFHLLKVYSIFLFSSFACTQLYAVTLMTLIAQKLSFPPNKFFFPNTQYRCVVAAREFSKTFESPEISLEFNFFFTLVWEFSRKLKENAAFTKIHNIHLIRFCVFIISFS